MKAGGLLTHLEKFGTYFGLKLSSVVFGATEQLSQTLQGKDTTIQEAKSAALLTISHLRRQRMDSTFSRFYDHVFREAHDITNEPVLLRKHKIPKRINDGAQCYQHETSKDYYGQKYYEVYDIVSNEIFRCFNQRDFTIIAEYEKLLLNAANNFDFTIPEPVHTTYEDDVQIDWLSVQLKMLPDIKKAWGNYRNTN